MASLDLGGGGRGSGVRCRGAVVLEWYRVRVVLLVGEAVLIPGLARDGRGWSSRVCMACAVFPRQEPGCSLGK